MGGGCRRHRLQLQAIGMGRGVMWVLSRGDSTHAELARIRCGPDIGVNRADGDHPLGF